MDNIRRINGYKVKNTIVKISKEEEEDILLNIYKILKKSAKINTKEVIQ